MKHCMCDNLLNENLPKRAFKKVFFFFKIKWLTQIPFQNTFSRWHEKRSVGCSFPTYDGRFEEVKKKN